MCYIIYKVTQGTVEATETTVFPPSTSQDCSDRSILSRLGEVFTSIFGGSSLGLHSKATIHEIKENLHILQENLHILQENQKHT